LPNFSQNGTSDFFKSTNSNSNGKDSFAPTDAGAKAEPKSLLDAISEIQQLAVIEKKAQNQIDPHYFTLKQQIEFFVIGLKTGVIEGAFFMFAFPILLVVTPAFVMYFYEYKFSDSTVIIFNFIGYVSLLFVTVVTLSLARHYNAGNLTRKAIDSFFFGRGSALIIKAIVSLFLFKWLYNISLYKPSIIYEICGYFDIFTFGINGISQFFGAKFTNSNFTQKEYYIFFYKVLAPILSKTGFEMFTSLLIAGLSPYLAVIYLRLRGDKGEKNKKKLDKY